jgi:nitrate reductase gamma subunit
MNTTGHYLDQLLFAILPYVAFFTFFLATIERYRRGRYSYSSLSSQFLENRQHFWSQVPFHYAILVVLTGHMLGFLIPREILLWNSVPARLYFLEITGLIFALLTVVGLGSGLLRRLNERKVRMVTSRSDWIVLWLLLLQVVTGIYIALRHPWGSSWFASSASPYIWSLLKFNPDISYVAAMPHVVKTHIVAAYVLIGFFPFTRLVHILVVPNPYLWRKPQVVRWWRRAERV